jgi:hypothetical protein
LLSVPDAPTVAGASQPVPASLYRYSWFATGAYSSRQVFVSGPKLDVIQTHTDDRSAAPTESAYCSANVCWRPEPLLGVTDTVVGGPLGATWLAAGAVQVPIVCHPLVVVDPPAYMKVVFAPAYAAVNVIGRLKVRVVPDFVTLAAASLIEP